MVTFRLFHHTFDLSQPAIVARSEELERSIRLCRLFTSPTFCWMLRIILKIRPRLRSGLGTFLAVVPRLWGLCYPPQGLIARH